MTGDGSHPPLFNMPPNMMPMQPGTFNSDDSPMVLAYRMGQVEHKVDAVLSRFDRVADLYVTQAALLIAMAPLKEDITELKERNKEQDTRKSNETSQFRLAITIAILSPVMSILISVLIGTK